MHRNQEAIGVLLTFTFIIESQLIHNSYLEAPGFSRQNSLVEHVMAMKNMSTCVIIIDYTAIILT